MHRWIKFKVLFWITIKLFLDRVWVPLIGFKNKKVDRLFYERSNQF